MAKIVGQNPDFLFICYDMH